MNTLMMVMRYEYAMLCDLDLYSLISFVCTSNEIFDINHYLTILDEYTINGYAI